MTGAAMLPFGLDDPIALSAIAAAAETVQAAVGDIDQVWCVGGSGVLCRGLQRGIKANSFHVVQVGRELKPEDIGAARVYKHPLDFAKDAKINPPFPSCSNYDAKVWGVLKANARGKKILFWNVMA
jgi:hypothetical protein